MSSKHIWYELGHEMGHRVSLIASLGQKFCSSFTFLQFILRSISEAVVFNMVAIANLVSRDQKNHIYVFLQSFMFTKSKTARLHTASQTKAALAVLLQHRQFHDTAKTIINPLSV